MSDKDQDVELEDEVEAEDQEEDAEGAVDTGTGKAKRRWNDLYGTKKSKMVRTMIGSTVRVRVWYTHPKDSIGDVVFTVLVRETGTRAKAVLSDGTLLDLAEGYVGGPYPGGLSEAQEDAQDRIVDRDFLLNLLDKKIGHNDRKGKAKNFRPATFDVDVEALTA